MQDFRRTQSEEILFARRVAELSPRPPDRCLYNSGTQENAPQRPPTYHPQSEAPFGLDCVRFTALRASSNMAGQTAMPNTFTSRVNFSAILRF